MISTWTNIVFSALFYGSILFLLSAGLQLVFGVQKIFNLACGSFYAMGAYLGITFVGIFLAMGGPQVLCLIPLILAGIVLSIIGPIVERGLLRFIYDRDAHFQMLLTFALVLMFEDVFRFVWGPYPRSTGGFYATIGTLSLWGGSIPVYNIYVICCSLVIAGLMAYMITGTRLGRVMRATASNNAMAQGLGVNISSVYVKTFTIGTALGTVGGALVIPSSVAILGMGVEAIGLAFSVVVIGGLGSMKGAFIGAFLVGLMKSMAIIFLPEAEMFLIYLIVILVLIFKPQGLYGSDY